MRLERWSEPRQRAAEEYRRARHAWDEEPAGRIERGGFGYRDGYRGAYAERPGYSAPRAVLRPPRPEGSGWPAPVSEIPPDAAERHLRAFADRDLAKAIDHALFNALGPTADRLCVYAWDGVITVEGRLDHPGQARCALDVAGSIPGVRRVRSALRVRRR
jgi:hypothetical protein